MVKTGRRAAALAALLERAGVQVAETLPRPPAIVDLGGQALERVTSLAASLGARMLPTRTGGWDLRLADGRFVELDEELHFNRYRAETLAVDWAIALPWRVPYLDYCSEHEARCEKAGRWGARWTTPSSEKLFGLPSHPGDFGGIGAPRWRQRALYDGVKDVIALETSTHLIRLAVHDVLGRATLEEALNGHEVDASYVRRLLMSRST